jgi:hypothetical protein
MAQFAHMGNENMYPANYGENQDNQNMDEVEA